MTSRGQAIFTNFGTVITFDQSSYILAHHNLKDIPSTHTIALFDEIGDDSRTSKFLLSASPGVGFAPHVNFYSDLNVASPIGELKVVVSADGLVNLMVSDRFLCAEPNGRLHARRDQAAAWETFLLVKKTFVDNLVFIGANSWFDTRRKTLVGSDAIVFKRKFVVSIGEVEYPIQQIIADLEQTSSFMPLRRVERLTEFSLHREGWKLEHYSLFKPLIYLAVYGNEIEDQLPICLDSLLLKGRYDGTILIIHNSTAVEKIIREHPLGKSIISWVVDASDRLEFVNLRFFLPKWRHARDFQPILYVDADVLFDAPVLPILCDIASLDKITAQVEPFSTLAESRMSGADLFASDGGAPSEPKNGFNTGVMGIPDLHRFSGVFADIAASVENYAEAGGHRGIPYCFNQPHANYVCTVLGVFDGDLLTRHVRYVDGYNQISHAEPLGLTHFWGPRGRKHLEMQAHLDNLLKADLILSVEPQPGIAVTEENFGQPAGVSTAPASPASDARVLSTEILFNSEVEYISFDIGGLIERGRYRAEMWVYIQPSDSISSLSLVFWGANCFDAVNATPTLVGEWQRLSITGEIAAGQTRALLRVRATGTGAMKLFFCPPSLRLDEKRSSFMIMKESGVFEATTFSKILADGAYRNKFGIEIIDPLEDAEVDIAPISFGQTVAPEFPMEQYPPGGWTDKTFQISGRATLLIPEARVLSDQGIVTFQGHLLKDTIRLADFKSLNANWVGADKLSLEFSPSSNGIERGSYHFAGYPGNRNYAHWVVDILATLPADVSEEDSAHLLLPEVLSTWQRGYIDLLPQLKPRMLFVGRESSVKCDTLVCISQAVSDSGHFPHPERLPLINKLIERTRQNSSGRKRRIYVSRQDSGARKLINESEVIALAQEFNFEVVLTSKMSVPEQISAFADCEMVMGPHGAGMANVIFCPSNTLFLELLTDTYMQWSMRRLASVASLRYGCVVGREVGSANVQQEKSWSVDISQVRKALEEVL